MKKFCMIVLGLLTAALFCACGIVLPQQAETPLTTYDIPEESEYTLTERQKEILQSQDLPTDFDSLTNTQQSAIISIEDMLVQLETAYGNTFEYSGYWSGADGQQEHLEAVCDLGTVTIYRTYNGTEYEYTDNYRLLEALPEYREQVSAEFTEVFGEGQYRFFVGLNESDMEKLSTGNVMGSVCAMLSVFVNEETDPDLDNVSQAIAEWFLSVNDGNATTVIIYTVSPESLEAIEDFNYADVVHSGDFSDKVMFKITADGEIVFY